MSRFALALPVVLLAAVVRADPPPIAAQAQGVLNANCAGCHGPAGKSKGGFGYVLDRERLVARQKVVPGKPAESELYERCRSGEMPPAGAKARLTEADLATLKKWIDAGAPAWQPAAPRSFVGDGAVLRLALDDIRSLPERQRRFMRYVSFAPLANAGAADGELRAHAQALAKLVNSLSWHPRATAPEPVDAARTVFRIDLRDYKWNARSWERLVATYPYRPAEETADARALAAATGSDLPVLRGDWLVATASRPPLYHDLLGLPERDKALERLVGVELLADQQDESASRAGFNGSGVSRNNRIIERHDASYGAYWRTYDFADNTERRNIFDHPLGPTAGGGSFVPDGGEIIFHLPNGLHGYLLVDGSGRRIDRAPVEIVSDPRRPDRAVENGLSCMSCHYKGVIPKADQLRAHVLKNRTSFAATDVASVKALYPTEAGLKARFDEDIERFTSALKKLGVPAEEPEPVSTAALRYEATLDLATMAAEVGLRSSELADQLNRSAVLARLLGPLKVKGGTVQRSVVVASFAEIAREVRRNSAAAAGAAELSPFTGHDGGVQCVAFSADDSRALSGGDDATLRLWDVASGKELRRFEGHREAVTAVAFSPGGRMVASGGRDRTVRVWDVESGKERARLVGHTGPVRCVAFSPGGEWLLSGSEDTTLRLWDIEKSKELRVFSGHTAAVSAVAFSPGGGAMVLSGGHDRTVRLWAVKSGAEMRRYEGHTKEVYAVAFSPDGAHVLSGGNDRVVRLWEKDRATELKRFEGHANAVIRVAFSADGKQVLSGSSQYQSADKVIRTWDVETGKELRSFGTGEGESVWCLAFSTDGTRALAGSSAKSLRLWKLK
jgi:WD40 repeat protein/mono/diheme cytochrome c family protein